MKGNKQMKNMSKIDKQVEILDRVTNKAIKKVELESKNKSRNYIVINTCKTVTQHKQIKCYAVNKSADMLGRSEIISSEEGR